MSHLGTDPTLDEVLGYNDTHQVAGITLTESLGDGPLFHDNRFYRLIRRRLLRSGFKLKVTESDPYATFPLVALDERIISAALPIRDNTQSLRRLVKQRPGFFKLRDVAIVHPTPNFIVHESAHAVAYRYLFGDQQLATSFANPANLPHVMLSEAYAMTAEYFFALATPSTPIGKWWLRMNSYRRTRPKRKAMLGFWAEHGGFLTAWLVLMAFFHFNMGHRRLKRKQLATLLKRNPLGDPGWSDETSTRARDLLNSVIEMNPTFLRETTPLFLGKIGYPRDELRVSRVADPTKSLPGAFWSAASRLAASIAAAR